MGVEGSNPFCSTNFRLRQTRLDQHAGGERRPAGWGPLHLEGPREVEGRLPTSVLPTSKSSRLSRELVGSLPGREIKLASRVPPTRISSRVPNNEIVVQISRGVSRPPIYNVIMISSGADSDLR